MSEAIDTTVETTLETTAAPEFIRPGSEQDHSKKGPIPAASDVPLDEINPVESLVQRKPHARVL